MGKLKKSFKKLGKSLGGSAKALAKPLKKPVQALSKWEKELGVAADLGRAVPGLGTVLAGAAAAPSAIRVGDKLLKGDVKGAGKAFGQHAMKVGMGAVPGLHTAQYALDEYMKRTEHARLDGEQQRQQTDMFGEGAGTGESLVALGQERTGGGVRLHRPFQGVKQIQSVTATKAAEPKIKAKATRGKRNAGITRAARGMSERLQAVKEAGSTQGE